MSLRLLETIERNFGLGSPPNKHALVRFDGFDELDKLDALKIFLGKSAADVAKALSQPESGFGTLGDTEDLIVMEPPGYQYYLAPYLKRILRNELAGESDLELIGMVLFAVREIVRIRGKDAFSRDQRGALLDLVAYLAEGSDRWDSSDAFAESLPEDLNWLRAALTED